MTQKEKLIASAQKFLAKGQLDRAVKEYEQALALDAGDQRNRQKLAELLVRAGRKEDAAREYGIIGKQYADHAFYLKAIAVYKQVQKLDPSNIEIALLLGDLNEKQGLKGNALAEYKMAVEQYERDGNSPAALKVLDRMCDVDPANANVRLKKGEMLVKSGKLAEAYAEFITAAVVLRRRGDRQGLSQLATHLRNLFPERKEFLLDILERQIQEGDGDATAADLQNYLQKNPGSIRAHLLLASIYAAAGRSSEQVDTLQKAHSLDRADIEVASSLITALIAADNAAAAAGIATTLLQVLGDAGAGRAEECFRLLLEGAPTHPAVLHALKDFYISVGDAAKAADMDARLQLVGGDAQPVSFSDDAGEESEPEVELSVTMTDSDQDGAYFEDTWEEEIDLSLEEDGLPSVVPEAMIPEAAPADDTQVSDAALAAFAPEEEALIHADGEAELDLPDDMIPIAPPPEEFSFDDEPAFADASPVSGDDAIGMEVDVEPERAAGEDAVLATTSHDGLDFDDLDGDDFSFLDEQPASSPAAPASPDVVFAVPMSGTEERRGESVRLDSLIEMDDTETHYNLGIAYKEMGLLADAIKEFSQASSDPGRRASCIALIGLCQRDAGDLDGAVATYGAGLAEGVRGGERATLSYELGVVLTMQGQQEEAATAFQDALDAVPGFLDAAARIRALTGRGEEDLAEAEPVDLELEELEEVEEVT